MPEFIEVDGTEGDDQTVSLHLYDMIDGHSSTCNWYYIDRKTGTGSDILGEDVDLTVPEAELYNPDVPQRADFPEGARCGVQYIGYFPEGTGFANTYNAGLIETFINDGFEDEYPFIGTLMNDQHFAGTQGATELWLIIPRDPEARVTVTECDPVAETTYGHIYSSYNGAPFFLYCNRSEIASDVQIQITDNAGEHEAFSVSISGMDGSPQVDSAVAAVLTPALNSHYGD